MLPGVFINAIATAHPPHDFQKFFLRLIPHFLSNHDLDIFRRLIARGQIENRYSCLDLDDSIDPFYSADAERFPTTRRRMELYKVHAPILAHRAAAQLLREDLASRITHIVIGSCTGFYAPGLDCDLIASLGLRGEVRRRLVGFMGCYAGLSVLQTAYEMVRADPASMVLTVNLELSSLHFQKPTDLHHALSQSLFADGCAATLVSARPGGIEISGFGSRLAPEHASAITWDITDQGFAMYLDPRLPRFLDRSLFEGLTTGEEKLWAIHPGGRSVLDAVRDRLDLEERQVEISRRILRQFGNMSSATVLFVLKEIFEGETHGAGCALAFGPGLALEAMRFRI